MIMASVSAAMVSVFIASFSLLRKCSVTGNRDSACFAELDDLDSVFHAPLAIFRSSIFSALSALQF